MGLSFSLPPGFLTLNPHHGPGAGCFWGTKKDLDRMITAEGPNFEKLVHGVLQARLSTNVAFDHATGLFSGEGELELLQELRRHGRQDRPPKIRETSGARRHREDSRRF